MSFGTSARDSTSGSPHNPNQARAAALCPDAYASRVMRCFPWERWRMLNPPNRRGTDPYARWWGRGGAVRRPPIPIDGECANRAILGVP